MPRDAGEPQFNFYIGWGDSPQNAGEHLFVQDANNPHLFYYPAAGETWSLESGEEMNLLFLIIIKWLVGSGRMEM